METAVFRRGVKEECSREDIGEWLVALTMCTHFIFKQVKYQMEHSLFQDRHDV